MARKKKLSNPFEGKDNLFNPRTNNAGDSTTDDDNIMAMIEDLRQMEKELGPGRFKKLFNSALKETLKDPEFKEMVEDPALDLDSEPGYPYEDDDDGNDAYWRDEDKPLTKEDWTATHPANLTCGSDRYYADLANALTDALDMMPLSPETPDEFTRELGRVLAAYLEDIVSGTKVFASMRRVCQERYGYPLPFYDCSHDDYMPDHINEEDIKFLIWKTICLEGKYLDKTYSPLAPGWEMLAGKMFDELNDRFEKAQEATRVADWLSKSFRNGDYMDIREIATWLVLENPLTYFPDYKEDLLAELDDYILENPDINPGQIFYGCIARESWQRSMSAMGCPSRTLVAAMAEEFGYHERAVEIEAIEVLPQQIYKVTQERKSRKIIFEDSAHRGYTVERDSFARGFRPDEVGYAICNLVCYQGKYLLNGLLSGEPELKDKWESEIPLLTVEQQRSLSAEWLKKLDGQQVVCVTNIKKILDKLGIPASPSDATPDAKNIVVLISRDLGLALIPDAGYAFNLPGNRFFRKRQAAKESFAELIFHNQTPHEVAMYIQQHKLLSEAQIGASQGKETGRNIVQDYMAFWIGFYRRLPFYGNAISPIATED